MNSDPEINLQIFRTASPFALNLCDVPFTWLKDLVNMFLNTGGIWDIGCKKKKKEMKKGKKRKFSELFMSCECCMIYEHEVNK